MEVATYGVNLYNKDLTSSLSHFKNEQSIALDIDLLTLGMFSKLVYGKNSYFNYSKFPIEVTMISGANLMIKKSIINKLGLFDPDFFMYFEDNELSVRIRKAGYKIMNVPDSKIIHLVGKSHLVKETSLRIWFNGRKIYYQKVHKKLYFSLANFIYLSAIITKIAFFYIINNKIEFNNWKVQYKILKEVNLK